MKYDSLTELRERVGHRVPKLRLIGEHPDYSYHTISIEFEKHEATVYCSSPEELGAIAFSARDRVREMRPAASRLIDPFWIWMSGATVFLGSYGFPASVRNGIQATGLVLYLAALIAWLGQRSFFGVRLLRRHEGEVWRRNRDALVVGVICTVLGSYLASRFPRSGIEYSHPPRSPQLRSRCLNREIHVRATCRSSQLSRYGDVTCEAGCYEPCAGGADVGRRIANSVIYARGSSSGARRR